MRKHLSILALAARGTVYKALLLFAAMAAAETTAFYFTLEQVLRRELPTLESAMTESRLHWFFAAAFLLLTVLLSLNGCAFSAKPGCTLSRLSVSERGFTLWQSLWHLICYFSLWALQVTLVFAFGLWYLQTAPTAHISQQTIFLAVHRVRFLFNLLPMSLSLRWIRNALFLLSISFTTACFSFRQRRGKLPLPAAVQTGVILFFFTASMTDSSADPLSVVLTTGILLAAAYTFLMREDPTNETISA